MKMHVREFAALTGVSARTLHYYDEIGLLKPSCVDEWNGYRYYDEKSLERMQEILFYRELDFPLKSISEILSSPDYNKQKALSEQKRLLTLKKERLERLIAALDGAEKGVTITMSVFDNSKFKAEREKYAAEAKEKWGDTAAYKEYEEKSAGMTEGKQSGIDKEMNDLLREFSECMKSGAAAESDEAQTLVKKWQEYITRSYYKCTKEILSSLGEMYVGDERFTANIDQNGEGTAEFMSRAIKHYTAEKY